MTDTLIHRIAEDMLPLPVEKFFTAPRAPDGMWFGDELPPSFQDYLADPQVQQAKWMFRYQVTTALAQAAEQAAVNARAEALTRQGRAPRRRR